MLNHDSNEHFKICKYCRRRLRIDLFINLNTREVYSICQFCRIEAKKQNDRREKEAKKQRDKQEKEAKREDGEQASILSTITRKVLGKD